MSWRSPFVRMGLVAGMFALLAFCFSYWWQGNLWHEAAGRLVLVFTLRHVLNNGWWWRLGRGRWTIARCVTTALTLLLALDVVVVTLTSLAISRSLSLPFPGIFALREVHWFAAWWMVALVGVHLGLNAGRAARFLGWHRLPVLGRAVLGVAALGLAVQGVFSGAILGLWPRLLFQYSLAMWDFNASVLPFFGHWVAVVMLFAVVGRGIAALLDRVASRTAPA